MGPKAKPKTPKGKQPAESEKNLNESVTQVEKEFFEFTLSDIEKKLNRIDAREEELKTGSVEIEEKIEELKKEKGEVITEHEQLLATREEEKLQKRNEKDQLSEEIKIRIKKYKICMEEWKIKYEKMVEKYVEEIEQQEEEIQDLENHKQNKDVYFKELDDLEIQMQEEEMQHKRKLFEIKEKRERALARLKKEIQSRILHFSTEFQKTSQKKLGKPCHRATVESKAIQNLVIQMQEEILKYQEKCENSKTSMINCKKEKDKKQLEKDKMIARTVIQLYVIKALKSEHFKLWEKLNSYDPIVVENKNLKKKFQNLSFKVDNEINQIEDTKKKIEDKIEETNAMKNAISHLRKKVRSLQLLIRNALKIAEEATAVRLIPIGKMEGEKYLPTEAKIRLFKKRRDSVFEKKGQILFYLLDVLSKAQLTDDDKQLLKGSTESLNVERINFSSIYGKPMTMEELEKSKIEKETEDEKKRKGPMFFTSLTSLPRSISTLVPPEKTIHIRESSRESIKEEEGEEEEEEMIEIEGEETELFDDFGSEESKESDDETKSAKDA